MSEYSEKNTAGEKSSVELLLPWTQYSFVSFDGHNTIPLGYGRGFMNRSEGQLWQLWSRESNKMVDVVCLNSFILSSNEVST